MGVELEGFPRQPPFPMWYWAGTEKSREDHGPVPQRLFFRRTLYSTETLHEAELYVAATGEFTVYVNGVKLEKDAVSPALWNRAQKWDLMGILRKGKNVIAVRVQNNAGQAYGLFPYLHLTVTQPDYLPQPPGFDQPFSLEVVAEGTYGFPFIKNFSSLITNVRNDTGTE